VVRSEIRILLWHFGLPASAFTVGVLVGGPRNGPQTSPSASSSQTAIQAYGKYGNGRSSSRYASGKERSERQERVGHLVRTELAIIIHRGYPVKHADPLDDDLLKRINIVNADVSPDLRNARITVSVTDASYHSTPQTHVYWTKIDLHSARGYANVAAAGG